MEFTVSGLETITIGGQPRQATKVVNVSGHREMLVWVVEGLPLPARLLQRKNGKDEIDLRITSVRQPAARAHRRRVDIGSAPDGTGRCRPW